MVDRFDAGPTLKPHLGECPVLAGVFAIKGDVADHANVDIRPQRHIRSISDP